jgi:hypothetical protein
MLTSDSIEERVWETVRLKKSLFAGVFDSPTGEVSFAKLGRKTVLQAVKEIFAEQPGRPKPTLDVAAPVPLKPVAAPAPQPAPHVAQATAGPGGIETAAAGLMEAGVRFIESIARDDGGGSSRLEQMLSGLFTRDTRTNRPVLSIPLPESLSQERFNAAISGLVNTLGRALSAANR